MEAPLGTPFPSSSFLQASCHLLLNAWVVKAVHCHMTPFPLLVAGVESWSIHLGAKWAAAKELHLLDHSPLCCGSHHIGSLVPRLANEMAQGSSGKGGIQVTNYQSGLGW